MNAIALNVRCGAAESLDQGEHAPRIEAVRYAAKVLKARPQIVWEGEELRIEVTDAKRLLLFTFIALGVDAPAAEGLR